MRVCVCQNLQMDYDRQSEQLEKEKERGEAAEKQIAELTKRLAAAITQVRHMTPSVCERTQSQQYSDQPFLEDGLYLKANKQCQSVSVSL